jgi:hypothetical protein
MVFITNNKTTKVLQPGKQAFNFPSLSVSPQGSTILGGRFDTVVFVWSNHLNATFFGQPLIKFVAVVSSVTYDFIRHILKKTGIKSLINKSYFMRASTGCVNGDRKTERVCKAHNLGSFAPFGFAHTIAPFFAGAKVPSIKPSLRSMPPRSFKSWASVVSILAKTPDSVHCWKRRWQVLFGGYRSGISDHWAPVRNIHRIPLSTSLGFCGGLPDFPGCALGFGMNSAIRCHCSFVRSISHLSAHINSKIEVLG